MHIHNRCNLNAWKLTCWSFTAKVTNIIYPYTIQPAIVYWFVQVFLVSSVFTLSSILNLVYTFSLPKIYGGSVNDVLMVSSIILSMILLLTPLFLLSQSALSLLRDIWSDDDCPRFVADLTYIYGGLDALSFDSGLSSTKDSVVIKSRFEKIHEWMCMSGPNYYIRFSKLLSFLVVASLTLQHITSIVSMLSFFFQYGLSVACVFFIVWLIVEITVYILMWKRNHLRSYNIYDIYT